MPLKLVNRARGFSPNLYFSVPFDVKLRFGVRRGDRIICTLERILDSKGNVMQVVGRKIDCSVAKRDGRFYVPAGVIQELNLIGVEYYEFTLRKLIKPGGKEIEFDLK